MRNRPRAARRGTFAFRAAGLLAALGALALAGSGYVGDWLRYADYASALLPFALPLGVVALLLARRSWTVSLLAIAAVGLCLGRMVPEWRARPEPGTSTGPAITIVTHNIHHGGRDPAAQADWLARSGADVLLLQENDARSAAALKRLASAYPYRDACGACELAILSKWPIVGGGVHWRLPGPDGRGQFGPALFRADISLPSGETIRVATIHAPRPLPPEVQAAFFAELRDALRYQRPRAFVLAGDFNQTPWGGAMARLDHGLLPLHRITRARFTYPADFPLLPIDQAFVSPDLIVEKVEVPRSTGSDHRPILIRLRLPAQF